MATPYDSRTKADEDFDDIVRRNYALGEEEATERRAKESLGESEAGATGASDGEGGKKPLTPEELREQEKGKTRGGKTKDPEHDRQWYRNPKNLATSGIKFAARKVLKKYKKAIIGTVLLNLLVAIILVVLSIISPFKNIHFETVLRSVSFARYQLIIRKQYSRVIFEASVLTQGSVGTYRQSPLVRQIQKAVPDRQIGQLGRSGRVKWEFRGNNTFGQTVLPLKETLKSVTIDDHTVDIDEISQRQFGRPYDQLQLREKWTVGSTFVNEVDVRMADVLAVLPRHVRYNPMFQMRQMIGATLSGLVNKAKELAGKKPDEARKLHVDETLHAVSDVTDEGHFKPTGVSDQLAEDATQWREQVITARKEARAPGEMRSSLASGIKGIRGASDVVLGTTIVCIGDSLANYFNSAEGEREAQAARFAMNIFTSSAQTRFHDTVSEAVGASDGDWNAVTNYVDDAAQSVIYKMVTNQPVDPTSATYQQQMNRVPSLTYDSTLVQASQAVVAGTPALAGSALQGLCDQVLKPGVQWTIAGIEGLIAAASLGSVKGITDGVKVFGEMAYHGVTGYGVSELLNWVIEKAIASVASTDFLLEQGSDRFGAAFVGAQSIAENSNRLETYGRPTDPTETAALDRVALNDLWQENKQSSFSNRYLSIDNPYSLIGHVVGMIPSSAEGFASNVHSDLAFIGSILSSPFRLVGAISNLGLFGTARAAGQTDIDKLSSQFGVDTWGWSVDELNRIDTDPSFSLPQLAARVEPNLQDLDARYGACYDPVKFALQYQRPSQCTRAFLSTDDALHWRYYKAMMFASQHLSGPV